MAVEVGTDWICDGLLLLLDQVIVMPIVDVDKEGRLLPSENTPALELVVGNANLWQKVNAHTNLLCCAFAVCNPKPIDADLSCTSIRAGCVAEHAAADKHDIEGGILCHCPSSAVSHRTWHMRYASQVVLCKQLLAMTLYVGNSGLALALLCYVQSMIRCLKLFRSIGRCWQHVALEPQFVFCCLQAVS